MISFTSPPPPGGNEFEEAKEKYRGVFEIQRSGDKTSSGEIGLDIRTHASAIVWYKSRSQDHGINDIGVIWKGVLGLYFKRFKSYGEA